jgi:hypothetical protein
MERKNEEKIIRDEKKFHSLHERYRWLDTWRGMTVVWLLIAFLTFMYSSLLYLDYPPPLGGTWLNHGYKYADYFPAIITVIDMGSSIFMFNLGISAPISFNSKVRKKGLGYAWITILTRFFMLLWVNIFVKIFYKFDFNQYLAGFSTREIVLLSIWLGVTIVMVVLHFLFLKGTKFQAIAMMIWAFFSVCMWYPVIWNENNVWSIFFGETLAYLAWGSLLSGLFLTIQKRPDYRIWSVLGMLILSFTLWEIAKSIPVTPSHWFFNIFPGTPLDVIGVPFNIISMGAIAVSATCISDWLLKKYDDPKEGIKKRIIPFAIITFCVHFIVDFFQPAEHLDGINVSLATSSIFICIFLLLTHYLFDKYFDVKIPFLTPLGRNALLMFTIQGIYLAIYGYFWPGIVAFRLNFPGILGNAVGVCLFVGPIALLTFIGWILDKFNIYIKF